MISPGARWRDALASLALVDGGAGGVIVHARDAPARQAWLQALEQVEGGVLRIPPSADADQLRGARDVFATLSLGQAVYHAGLAQRLGDQVLLICGAERLGTDLAALLAHEIDAGLLRFVLVDEGEGEGTAVSTALQCRAAMEIWLDGIGCVDIAGDAPVSTSVRTLPAGTCEAFCEAALRLGVAGSRSELHACRVARAASAFCSPDEAVELASRLVLAPRARAMADPGMKRAEEDAGGCDPAVNAAGEVEPGRGSPCRDRPDEIGAGKERDGMADHVIAAVRTVLPELNEPGASKRAGRSGSAGQLAARKGGGRRGRPGRCKAGVPGRDGSLDVIGTLLAAAADGRRAGEEGPALRVTRPDIRIRTVQPSRCQATVFAVDASGSSELARLAEVKGAIESVLARSYARRDEMALIAFRRTRAETIIPRTRSLARARRELQAMPSGGATPLAAGLMEALAEAIRAEQGGSGALIVVLTDGGANIALDGRADRAAAREDGLKTARAIAASGIPAVLIDSNPRPAARLRELATAMNARCLPLPRLQPEQIADALSAARTA